MANAATWCSGKNTSITKTVLSRCQDSLSNDPILFGSTVKFSVSELCVYDIDLTVDKFSNYLREENQLVQIGMASTELDVQIDSCLMSMRPNEISHFIVKLVVHCRLNGLASEELLHLKVGLKLEMKELLVAKPIASWHPETILEMTSSLQSAGNEAFKSNRRLDALNVFKQALTIVLTTSNKKDVDLVTKHKLEDLKKTCYSNLCACHFAWFLRPESVVFMSTKVLELEPMSVKNLYRRGVAYLKMKDFERAKRDFIEAHSVEPNNKLVNQKLNECIQEQNKFQKALAQGLKKMFNSTSE